MGVLTPLAQLFSGRRTLNVEKRFELLRPPRRGSMAKVFCARDLRDGKRVALKILDQKKLVEAQRHLPQRRPGAEGEISVELRHENIVRTFEHGTTSQGNPYLVMEWLEGRGLDHFIRLRTETLQANALEYLQKLAAALEYIHLRNYIHHDVCPRNVLICGDRQVKLIDFGLTIPNTPEFCRPGNRTGKAPYMAPELVRHKRIDERIVVFSFSVTAYETLAGRLPWEGSDIWRSAMRRLTLPPPPLREVCPAVQAAVAEVVMKGLEPAPADRWSSMRALRIALKAAIQDSS